MIAPRQRTFFSPVPLVLYVLVVLSTPLISNSCAQEHAPHPLPVARQIVEAACGECQFGMAGESCDLAIRIDGATFYVDGSSIDDHGDAHADNGLCNKVRKALVRGHIAHGRFVADEFRLIDLPGDAKPLANEETFNQVWSAVNERFYRGDFNGVDWEKAQREFLPQAVAASSRRELAAIINRMLGLLKTSHTNFYTPDDIEYYHLADVFSSGPLGLDLLPNFPDGRVSYVGIGMLTQRIGEDWFIRGVLEGGPAAQAGLRRGQRIVSVDGKPFEPVASFADKLGAPVAIEVQSYSEPSSRTSVTITPIQILPQQSMLDAMKASMRLVESNRQKIAYVRIWSYAGQQFQDALVDAIAAGPFKEADALIIDLRDGLGGANPDYLQLFNKDIPVMSSFDRAGEKSTFNIHWHKPAALLVNEGTRSGKELIAFGFRQANYGPVIGTRTAGAVTAGTLIPIGSDGLLYLAVRAVEVDGESLEGRGVEPDHVVPWDLPYASPEDPQLQRAIELLGK